MILSRLFYADMNGKEVTTDDRYLKLPYNYIVLSFVKVPGPRPFVLFLYVFCTIYNKVQTFQAHRFFCSLYNQMLAELRISYGVLLFWRAILAKSSF